MEFIFSLLPSLAYHSRLTILLTPTIGPSLHLPNLLPTHPFFSHLVDIRPQQLGSNDKRRLLDFFFPTCLYEQLPSPTLHHQNTATRLVSILYPQYTQALGLCTYITTFYPTQSNSSAHNSKHSSSLVKFAKFTKFTMPAPHAVSPLAIPPSPRNMRLVTSQDLYTSINATLASKDNRPSTPGHHIKADDYAVPAPPPPSPVSFRPEHWPTSIRR